MIAQSPHLAPDQFIAVRCRIGQLALFQNFRPEFRDNIEKAERDLPPVGKIIGRNAGKLTPFGIVGFDLIHQASQITRKPNRVRSCCGNRNIIDAKQRPHMRRQRFTPWTNETRQQQQPFSLANWRIEIEYAACGRVEKAASSSTSPSGRMVGRIADLAGFISTRMERSARAARRVGT